MKEYDLIDLRSFLAVVDTGSFSNASIQMETSSATISRRISSLEEALGVRLLNRTTRQLELTTTGQQFWQDVKDVLEMLEQAEERLFHIQEKMSGIIKMAAPLTFGVKKLAPLLPLFMQQYPQIIVHLQLEDRLSDLVGEGIDVSLRIGELRDSTLIASRLHSLPRLFCASPAYLSQHGTPRVPADLNGHSCLRYSLLSAKDEWEIADDVDLQKIHFPLASVNGDVLREAAIQGLGLVMLPLFIVEDAIHNGTLIPVLQNYALSPLPLSLVRPSRRYTPVRVIALMEWLQQHFTA